MQQSIHRIGDAATKFRRTSDLMHYSQGELTFMEFIDTFSGNFTQFSHDFESLDPAHKGFINLNEFNCFLLLQAINRQTYRSVYDEQLRGTPSGRFENPAALIAIFQQYELSHRMSFNADAVSVQGAAYLTQSKVSSAAPVNLNPEEKAPY